MAGSQHKLSFGNSANIFRERASHLTGSMSIHCFSHQNAASRDPIKVARPAGWLVPP